MRYAQLVLGPAGSGKSRYCSTMQRHAANSGRRIEVVNLDPAAEQFDYEPLADVKDLIQVGLANTARQNAALLLWKMILQHAFMCPELVVDDSKTLNLLRQHWGSNVLDSCVR